MASAMPVDSKVSNSAVMATPVTYGLSRSLQEDLELQSEYGNELSRFSRPLLDFAATMTIMIMVAGIVGNLLTIVALIRCPRVRNVAAAFIISLCVADFMFCTFVLPFSSSRFIYGTWIHGDFLCQLFPFMRYGNIGVSLLLIAMITVNRYVMIAHHNVYNRIYKKIWIGAMIALCWVLSFGMQIPTLLGVWGMFGLDGKLGTCTILKDSSGNSSKTALFVIAFVIPCCVIVCCYTRIFWVVHKSESRMREHAALARKSKTKAKEQRELKTKRNEWRITKMVLAIFLSFLTCYLPITIVKVADDEVRFPGLHVLSYIMLYLSACINPIIYVIMNKQYRQAYKTVLLWQRPRLLSLTPVGSSYADKSKDGQSKTMVSQVSIAMSPLVLQSKKNEELPEVFDDNL